ncbi:hypothetical protein COCSUDRAFT_61270 [Coccomyxa subellipsoidea C-169]|uniref:DEK-C domain-containing protein n=1 Tax=Coccomyxa subellipsoidea (strain C-169) TaxID=574566 RepID=I0Z302_COCSC|nr:hypothetical protein COCSUDRAFT_61270 [Coccomyxa subellipsoidea C-169]EIE25021.1 hypothetical protein COCSUDRAFT_61270 [Coccomyxa subellipsoidea C-169]|eukprot:XP_005649565.1 hypothetical protein COCSUDRAFT_61270 [Coccomyxa subellipsoidea C-169]
MEAERAGHVSRERLASAGAASVRLRPAAPAKAELAEEDILEDAELPRLSYDEVMDARPAELAQRWPPRLHRRDLSASSLAAMQSDVLAQTAAQPVVQQGKDPQSGSQRQGRLKKRRVQDAGGSGGVSSGRGQRAQEGVEVVAGDLKARIAAILRGADLEMLTLQQVAKQLQQEFGGRVTAKAIRKEVDSFLQVLPGAEEERGVLASDDSDGTLWKVSIEEELNTPFSNMQPPAANEERKSAPTIRRRTQPSANDQSADLGAATLSLHWALISLAAAHRRSATRVSHTEHICGAGAAVPVADMAPGQPLSQRNGEVAAAGAGTEPEQAAADALHLVTDDSFIHGGGHAARGVPEECATVAAGFEGRDGHGTDEDGDEGAAGMEIEPGSQGGAAGNMPGSEGAAAEDEGEVCAAAAAAKHSFRLAYALLEQLLARRWDRDVRPARRGVAFRLALRLPQPPGWPATNLPLFRSPPAAKVRPDTGGGAASMHAGERQRDAARSLASLQADGGAASLQAGEIQPDTARDGAAAAAAGDSSQQRAGSRTTLPGEELLVPGRETAAAALGGHAAGEEGTAADSGLGEPSLGMGEPSVAGVGGTSQDQPPENFIAAMGVAEEQGIESYSALLTAAHEEGREGGSSGAAEQGIGAAVAGSAEAGQETNSTGEGIPKPAAGREAGKEAGEQGAADQVYDGVAGDARLAFEAAAAIGISQEVIALAVQRYQRLISKADNLQSAD